MRLTVILGRKSASKGKGYCTACSKGDVLTRGPDMQVSVVVDGQLTPLEMGRPSDWGEGLAARVLRKELIVVHLPVKVHPCSDTCSVISSLLRAGGRRFCSTEDFVLI